MHVNTISQKEAFEATYTQLQKWADMATDDKLWRVYVAFEKNKGATGNVLKVRSTVIDIHTMIRAHDILGPHGRDWQNCRTETDLPVLQ